MMRFYKNLYTSAHIRNLRYLKWRLRHHAGNLSVYVIALCGMDEPARPADGGGQIEFYHNVFLQQPYYRQHAPYIIGLASGRAEAMDLCAQIVQEAVDATGRPDIYSYLFPSGEIAEYFAS